MRWLSAAMLDHSIDLLQVSVGKFKDTGEDAITTVYFDKDHNSYLDVKSFSRNTPLYAEQFEVLDSALTKLNNIIVDNKVLYNTALIDVYKELEGTTDLN